MENIVDAGRALVAGSVDYALSRGGIIYIIYARVAGSRDDKAWVE